MATLTDSPVEIDRVAMGIRFQPKFKIADRLGSVADAVLGSQAFGGGIFPKIGTEGSSRVLFNDVTGDKLVLGERDCILDMRLKSTALQKIQSLAENFENGIIGPMVTAGLTDVTRYGLLLRLSECSAQVSEAPMPVYLGEDGRDAQSMDLRFTKRMASAAAKAAREVNDFRNLIFLVSQDPAGGVELAIDYQENFDPPRKAKGLWSFTRFSDEGLGFYSDQYQRWLDRFFQHRAA